MRITILSQKFPPDRDGIGDHTWWLSRQLAGEGHEIRVVTTAGAERDIPEGVSLDPILETDPATRILALPKRLQSASAALPDWIVVQYNPFSFGRYGFCPFLPVALSRLRACGARIAPLFHETMVPRWPWRFFVMRLWQHRTFCGICRIADASFISTNRWRDQVKRVSPRLPCHHLPVGSNIGLSDVPKHEARRQLGLDADGLLIGAFGQAHVSRLFPWIGAVARGLAARDRGAAVLYVGPQGGQLRKECSGVKFVDLGFQPPEHLGVCLRAADLVVSPYSDGISTRRGSAMAPLQHGIPVATTRPDILTDEVFLDAPPALLLSRARNAGEFAADVADWWRLRQTAPATPDRALMDYYEREFSWQRIAGKLIRGLSCAGAQPGESSRGSG